MLLACKQMESSAQEQCGVERENVSIIWRNMKGELISITSYSFNWKEWFESSRAAGKWALRSLCLWRVAAEASEAAKQPSHHQTTGRLFSGGTASWPGLFRTALVWWPWECVNSWGNHTRGFLLICSAAGVLLFLLEFHCRQSQELEHDCVFFPSHTDSEVPNLD